MTAHAADPQALAALCQAHGIASEYADIWGTVHPVPDATRIALLRAMDAIRDEGDVAAALDRHQQAQWQSVLPPVLVCREHALPYRLCLRLPLTARAQRFSWTLELEAGESRSGEFRPKQLQELRRQEVNGICHLEVAFDWHEALPPGYHRYVLRSDDGSTIADTTLIVTPERCYLPERMAGGERAWGPALQLYGLRSEHNWGMGDLGDLRTAVRQWGRRGATVVGVNPLHALFLHSPRHASPYSPSSRDFLNALYIDVEAVATEEDCAEVIALLRSADWRQQLAALRQREQVDYDGVARAKLPVLAQLHAHFRQQHLAPQTARGKAFRTFQSAQGEALRRYAIFHALQEHLHAADPAIWGWPAWPAACRDPAAPAVARFAQEHAPRVEFHEYLQWLADMQLGRVQDEARALGMEIGLYRDLAVSIAPGGAQTWSHQDLYALDASVGAPPDLINLAGQNWGLPPPRPAALRGAAYAPFIATLRANMRHAGALRIDHVMCLSRLFCIPAGGTGAQGTYVSYPFEDLLGIVALESRRNRCVVIGEDLGTVSDEVRAGLHRTGVLSYRVLFFERDAAGEFRPPGDYPVDALVTASTHDLPTLAGYWHGRDLELRASLGLFREASQCATQQDERARDRLRLLQALQRDGLLPAGLSVDQPAPPEMTPALALAIHTWLARTPSRMLVFQLEDVLGVAEQANLPGTIDEHPNWRRTLPLTLEQMDDDARLDGYAGVLAATRGSS